MAHLIKLHYLTKISMEPFCYSMFSIFLFITANFYVFSYSDVEEMEHYAGVPLPTLYSGDRDQSKMGELIVIWLAY